MVYEELQIRVLQKLFEIDGDKMEVNESTEPFIKAIPGACNECLAILAAYGKAIRKNLSIIQGDEVNSTVPQITVSGYNGYDIKALGDEFLSLYNIKVWFDDGISFMPYTDYQLFSDTTLLFNSSLVGKFLVEYNAYHERINENTPKSFEFELDNVACEMMALYIAGQLLKDDDVQKSGIYMNEFDTWIQELKILDNKAVVSSCGNWSSVTGW